MKKNFAYFALSAFVLSLVLTGCETTKGAGRDIQTAGQNIQKTADNAEH